MAAPSDLAGRLLFTQRESLWTWTLPGGEQREIVPVGTIGQQVTSARWSPDGTQVAYALFDSSDPRNPVSQVFLASPTGEGVKVLVSATRALDFYQAPVWAPDGHAIYAMHSGGAGQQRINRIIRISIDTGAIETIVDEVGFFDVSPDGRWLALVRSALGGLSLGLLDLQTREWRTLIADGLFDNLSAPRFDPSSQNLLLAGTPARTARAPDPPVGPRLALGLAPALAAAHGLPQDLYLEPIAGGPPKPIAPLQADDPALTWAPDGQRLAVFWIDSLSILPAQGGPPARILTPGSYGSIDWVR